MPELIFAPSARQDLLDIFAFIARDKPSAAMKWIDDVEAKCALIATSPGFGEARPAFGENIRSSSFGRYVIFFQRLTGGAEIVRIIDGSRDIRSL